MLYQDTDGAVRHQTPHSPKTCMPKACVKDTLRPKQRLVYDTLVKLKKAMGAYELLDLLRSDNIKAPTIIYRALKALEEKGLVHYISQSKKFVAFPTEQAKSNQHVFLVCDSCQSVTVLNADSVFSEIESNAKAQDFTPSFSRIELAGDCKKCSAPDA